MSSRKLPSLSGVFRAWLMLILVIAAVSPVSAAPDQGIQWLQAQQQSDGSYYSQTESFAGKVQATAEVERARLRYGQTASPEAYAFLRQNASANTEDLARRIIAGKLSGNDVASLVASLTVMQNEDGGFGEHKGYQSTVLDTAFALEALATARSNNTTVAGRAIGFLMDSQKADGGFGLTKGADASVYVTALASNAMQKYLAVFDVSSRINAAVNYLLSRKQADSTWGSDWESAQALLAIIPAVGDEAQFADAVQSLRDKQGADGSWGQSVYATALALRTLYLADYREVPTSPDTAEFIGRVLDLASGAGIQSAKISVDGHAGLVAYTDNNGEFRLKGVPAGQLTVRYEAAGYNGATQTVQSRGGMLANLGDIKLSAIPDVGNLVGTVTDAASGQPIANATVSVTGPASVSASTGASGEYRLASAPGSVTITISAMGYDTVSASANLAAGMTLAFSPALSVSGAPGGGELKVIGQIVDAADGTALAGAKIQAQSGAAGTTASDGHFEVTGIQPGQLTLSITLDGYQPLQASTVLPDSGTVNLGVIRLKKSVTDTNSTLVGRVTDAQSGQPIAGVRVLVVGTSLETSTAADGSYRLEGITDLSFTVALTANGYNTEARNVTLSRHGAITIDAQMTVSTTTGVAIDSLIAKQPSYPAYSEPTLTAVFRNSGNAGKTLQLLMTVTNEQGRSVDFFPAVHEPLPGEITDSILTVPAGGNVLAEFRWKAKILPPGVYRVTLRAQDNDTLETLAQNEAQVTIDTTAALPRLQVTAKPVSTNLDAVETVSFTAETINRSNAAVQTQFNYRWTSPSGAVLKEGIKELALQPADTKSVVELESFSHTFTESGEYKLTVQVVGGVVPDAISGSSVHVAPKVRIDPAMSVDPSMVLPEGQPRIRFKIELKGSEQK